MIKVESDFIHDGLRCVVAFQSYGHRCGYVGVPVGHPLFGIKYSDMVADIEDMKDEPIGKRGIIPIFLSAFSDATKVRADVYFDVHGGLTYSDIGETYPVESDLWWFGFDCAHSGDGRDYDKAVEYGLLEKEMAEKMLSYSWGGQVRSVAYVETECKSLVEQINKFALSGRTNENI